MEARLTNLAGKVAQKLNMKQIKLDFSRINSISDFHDILAEILEFPPYYGRNKDAFWDCLSDLEEKLEFVLVGFEELDEALKVELSGYVELLKG